MRFSFLIHTPNNEVWVSILSQTLSILWMHEALLQCFANTVESGDSVRYVLGCPVICSSSRSDDLVFSIKQ